MLEYLQGINDKLEFDFRELKISNDVATLKLEEVFGMIFKHIKNTVDHLHSVNAEECTITVPSHWEYRIKRILMNSAQIAGLKIL